MVYKWAKNSQNEDFYIKNVNKEMFRSHSQCLARVDPIKFFFPKATAKGSFEKRTTIKDCRSDGCLERLSSKTAEVITVFKDCHQRLPK